VIEKLLAKVGREIGFGVIQKRCDVVLQSAFAAALIVDEKRIAGTQENVAGLEVTVEEIIARSTEKEFGEAAEIVFEGLFVEWNTGQAKKIVFEIVQVPGDGLSVEAGDGIADLVIQVAARFDLEAREHGDNFAIGFDDLRSDAFARPVLGEEFEERSIAEVFFEIGAVVESFGVNFRNGKAVTAKMFGEFEEGGIFFADAVENADRTVFFVDEPDDFSARAAEFALQRQDALWRRVEVLLEEVL